MNVLFVCTGNICRSPLAEGILRSKYSQKGIMSLVDSCGFESFHVGDPPDHRAQEIARINGIDLSMLRARLFSQQDFDRFDKIFVMDNYHYQAVMRNARNDHDREKVDFVLNVLHPGRNHPVKDPYYDEFHAFKTVFRQLDQACEVITDMASTEKRS
jgi:protein-tyrosine phosphatase